jgi:8-oxo-dGTP pyrophosphatase MutT (NUDIX family)
VPRNSDIDVVCALILNAKGEALMTLRGPKKLRPNMWEMPGGKVDKDVSEQDPNNEPIAMALCRLTDRRAPSREHASALHRELREELGADVVVGPLVASTTFDWNGLVYLSLYHCILREGSPVPAPLDAEELGYFDLDFSLDHMAMTPSQYDFHAHAKAYLQQLANLRDDVRLLQAVFPAPRAIVD